MANVQQGGRVALVTGASRGIGSGVARLLASRGMRVVVNYRSSRDKADDVVASIGSTGGQAMAVQADVRDGDAVLGMVEQVRAAMGDVEVLVHSALTPYARSAQPDQLVCLQPVWCLWEGTCSQTRDSMRLPALLPLPARTQALGDLAALQDCRVALVGKAGK